MEFKHKSVLLNESIEMLRIDPEGIYVDGTAGGAGHSKVIASKLTSGRLFAFDQDPDAVKIASERLKGLPATVIHANFKDMAKKLLHEGVQKVDGILLDLGVSSWQLDNRSRGFSYHDDAPLDMRMSQEGVTAADLVNTLSAEALTKIFRDYGEEQFSKRIAEAIVKRRETAPILTTLQLSEIISENVPAAKKRAGHPARKCFQALRIAVNEELDILEKALKDAFGLLNIGGVLAVITFHSLEDRIVKNTFRELCRGCICPPELPVCVCHRKPMGKLAARKPIVPTDEELQENARSRSAKLRGIIKIRESATDE